VNHVCIVMTTTSPRWPFQARDAINHIDIAPRVTTDNGEAALRLVLDGAGVVRLRDMMVGSPIRQGFLVSLLTDNPLSRAGTGVGSLSGGTPLPAEGSR
jgi:DNA-binding transcriptional LysR family regulator